MLEFFRSIGKRNEDGASAVEYGLLVAGIAALIVAIVFAFGGVISGVFKNTCNTVAAGVNSGGGQTVGTC
ncbi:MAG: Flp family type IVb pilin [Marmoricola sp.]|nr:Flp family type IVb pilin [Marmoricola sp.]